LLSLDGRSETTSRRRTLFGAQLEDSAVRFRLWCPRHDRVSLKLYDAERTLPMAALSGGWHEFRTDAARPGSLYQFVLSDGQCIPDPVSRFQPFDVHGPSEVIDPGAYRWADTSWRGRAWEEAVLYELHVGAFTPEGTFRGAVGKLDALADLGVTAIQLMPVADFPGLRNWGYDGVQLFAPDSSYGRPEDLKALVDAAHARGLMVFLDVVYNHFGPEGSYLPACAPIFTEHHHTAWGAAVNYDAEGSDCVRELVVSNAVYWIEEFHMDGLRLDAVHAIKDDSAKHILTEIARRVREAAGDRQVHLVLENEENSVSLLRRDKAGRPERYTAQWNDDVHHVLHTAATCESAGYYSAYTGDTEKLGRALAEGFAFQGEMMDYRGRARGEPSAELPPTAFVSFVQNHDQIGNRAFGDRLANAAQPDALRAVTAIYLLSPQIPMLFMGEEWGTERPFPFFCDFGGDLADAVRDGRRKEFARFPEFKDEEMRERIPDPNALDTFLSAKLDWERCGQSAHAEWHNLYRLLLAIRHQEIIPRLKGIGGHSGRCEILGDQVVHVTWRMGDGSTLTLVANLGTALVSASMPEGRMIWPENVSGEVEPTPWSAFFALSDGRRDGR
jgi:maltooligosyltrehalose trehalohydrolase